jgi:predicted enzyme related to lactoylglutathione lyase
MASDRSPNVAQLRLVVEAEDFDEAIAFYGQALGLEVEFDISSEGDARVVAFKAGRATLEIINASQKRLIDRVETGREGISPKIRVAFEVGDSTAATRRLQQAGANVLAPPTETPWRSLNSRLEGPAGLQLTLFEELDGKETE